MVALMKLMNSPPPMDSRTYREKYDTLLSAYEEAASESMMAAANEATGSLDADGIKDVRASFDGSWQRRGYSSMNGTVICIVDGKVVDNQVLTKICHSCRYWKKNTTLPGYQQWKLSHDCSINHIGSAGSMEAAGVMSIFKRSGDSRRLRYMKYLGDGDSKAHKNVVDADVYEGKVPEKEECVGHVQKRVGARLRTLKQQYKGIMLDDKKRLTGPGRLTDRVINTLQNYYGMVIRSNSGDLYQMKKGVASILFHCSEFKHENGEPNYEKRYKYCSTGKKSWCVFQRDKCTGKTNYKPKINIPEAVRKVIKPIFSHSDLGADTLLGKCLHGLTQNVNESFNQIIWTKAPKDVYVAKKTLNIAMASAVIAYNDGSNGILNVFYKLGLHPGYYTLLGCTNAGGTRVKQSNYKHSDSCKLQRKRLRAQRKGWQDNVKITEEKSYSPGGFLNLLDCFMFYLICCWFDCQSFAYIIMYR